MLPASSLALQPENIPSILDQSLQAVILGIEDALNGIYLS